MCQSNSCESAGQADFPLFQVVLVDAAGIDQGFIGYQFYEAGAKAGCEAWNNYTERGDLTAVIRPVCTGCGKSHASDLVDDIQPANRRLMVMTGNAKQFILPTFCTDDDLEFYRDVLADAEAVDIVEDCQPCGNGVSGSRRFAQSLDADEPLDHVALSREFTGFELILHKMVSDGWRPAGIEEVSRLCYWLKQVCLEAYTGPEHSFDFRWDVGQDASSGTSFPFDGRFADMLEPLDSTEATSSDSNALVEQDDSDVMEGSEDATHASTEGGFSDGDRYDLERDAKVVRGRFVREVFRNHWAQVEQSIDLLADWGDVGIVSRSLEALAETMGGEQDYASGTDGGWSHAELAESLGFEVATA